MEFLILNSTEDEASMNMRDFFSKSYKLEKIDCRLEDHDVLEFKELKTNLANHIYLGLTDSPLIFLNELKISNEGFKPDLMIFASRHRSEAARPAFLVHSTGNWTENNEFGGDPKRLSKTSAILLKSGYISLMEHFNQLKESNFSVDIEVTHHGPTNLGIPLIFMELGSTKTEWVIKDAGELVAKAILDTVERYSRFKHKNNQQIGLGFGGTHYGPNFSRIISNKNIALSFICPKYYILDLNKRFVEMMVDNTLEVVECFIIDWKGTNSEQKKHLIPILEEFDIPIKKTKDFSSSVENRN